MQMSQIKVEGEQKPTGTACLEEQDSNTKSCPKGRSHHMSETLRRIASVQFLTGCAS